MALPDLAGKTILITGANTGIGRASAEALAAAGAHVVLACRSEEKTRPVLDAIQQATPGARAEFMPLDLADLGSVRALAEAWLARGTPLHVLLNNAGLVTPGQTRDGFELVFGVNHLGHFLLTALLWPSLQAAGQARVVNVASTAHRRASGIDFDALQRPTASTTAFPEYAVSKLANVLFAREMARRLGPAPTITAYSLHPGVIASDVWRRVPWPIRPLMLRFMRSVEDGAATSLYCATAPEAARESGLYYEDCRVLPAAPLGQDDALAATLWARSEAWTGVSFLSP